MKADTPSETRMYPRELSAKAHLRNERVFCATLSMVLPLLYSSIAQSVEHAAVNRAVVGSSPTRGAILHGLYAFRPHGQAVKTSPFHGGNTSSNLVGVT